MSASTTNEPHRPGETLEEYVADAGLAAAAALRAAEIALVVLVGLLVCPPLAILVVVVVAPMLAAVLVMLLLAAVLSVPYLLVHRLRGHRGHGPLLAQRLRHARHALIELLPHRLVAGARHAPGLASTRVVERLGQPAAVLLDRARPPTAGRATRRPARSPGVRSSLRSSLLSSVHRPARVPTHPARSPQRRSDA
jgi:hypothetical protein